MESIEFFRILDRVDSTNNYAMAAVHAGLAKHGMAWFARDQHSGKGQRGKEWISRPGENIIMSMVFEPPALFLSRSFLFNAVVSNCCHTFLSRHIKNEIKIKWPNDIYLRDRKAGGILIENIYLGQTWKWAVVGIGINVNQVNFPGDIKNAVSMKQVTAENYDTIALAKELHEMILAAISNIDHSSLPGIIKTYNGHLYLANEKVRLRKQNVVFETTIKGVNEQGQLLTTDNIPRQFDFGEIEWIL
jgi:BirA family transcriptional regulator, biotin operon repressor / biotin---[acetyl-CoA-carboxylase] ligase